MTEPYKRLRQCSYESWKTNRTHHWMPAFGDKAIAATNLGSIDETMGVSAPSQPTIHSTSAVDSDTPKSSSLMSLVRVHYCYQVPDLELRLHELIRRRSGDGRRAPIPPRFYLCICITLWHSARAYGVFYPGGAGCVAGDLR